MSKKVKGFSEMLFSPKWFASNVLGIDDPKDPPKPPDPELARRQAELDAKSASDERRRRIKNYGRPSTTATGPMGLVTAPNLGKKRLLGQ
jgi:hypothetical protein